MINKTNNEQKALEAIAIAKRYSVENMVSDLENFNISNKQYKVHILMIGGFSAGKSALLNKFIGKSILKEDQAPETAVATELHYSENERIIANFMDGSKRDLSTTTDINLETVRNLEYYLNSDNLKIECDYVIVDTPGFDSGIEKHNKALMQYIDRGTAYFLVVDCEKGTISESALNFVNEVSNYSGDIAVILNKCDKKIAEEVEEIKEHIEDLLLASCGREFPIVCTSIRDADVASKIVGLIERFQPQYLYEKNMTSILNKKRSSLASVLELVKNSKTCDTVELDDEIQKRESTKQKLLEQVEIQRKRMSTKLHSEVKENIINNISSQLMSNAPMLANAYKGGVELFQEKVVEIIRPIMINTVEEYSNVAYEDFIKHLNYDDLKIQGNVEEISDMIVNVYDKLKVLGENHNLMLPVDTNGNSETLENGIKTYRAVSSILAIATEFVAPPLELLIVFLPDIIKLLNAFTGTSKEQQLVEAIQNKIIPQIVAKIRTELDKSLCQVETVMIDNIGLNIKEIIDIENQALASAKKRKAEMKQDYTEFVKNIDEDIFILRK